MHTKGGLLAQQGTGAQQRLSPQGLGWGCLGAREAPRPVLPWPQLEGSSKAQRPAQYPPLSSGAPSRVHAWPAALFMDAAVPAGSQSRLVSRSLSAVVLHHARSRRWCATVLAVRTHVAAMRGGLPRYVQLEGRGHASQLGPCSCVQVAQEAVELAGCLPQRSRRGPGRPSFWQARSTPLCLRGSAHAQGTWWRVGHGQHGGAARCVCWPVSGRKEVAMWGICHASQPLIDSASLAGALHRIAWHASAACHMVLRTQRGYGRSAHK